MRTDVSSPLAMAVDAAIAAFLLGVPEPLHTVFRQTHVAARLARTLASAAPDEVRATYAAAADQAAAAAAGTTRYERLVHALDAIAAGRDDEAARSLLQVVDTANASALAMALVTHHEDMVRQLTSRATPA